MIYSGPLGQHSRSVIEYFEVSVFYNLFASVNLLLLFIIVVVVVSHLLYIIKYL